ncbi:MAG: OmpA family protein [Acidobacteria bacterium]|nr:OmpA family protein [Acidobacteriota bacterium]
MRIRCLLATAAIFILFTSACATKKFVRKEVQTVRSEMETATGELSQKTEQISEEVDSTRSDVRQMGTTVEELSQAHRDTSRELAGLSESTKRVEGIATRASADVGTLNEAFLNRNRYEIIAETQVNFALGSSRLQQGALEVLDEIAGMLLENSDAILTLEGRTDSSGSDQYNIVLGDLRAESVIRYLVVEKGIPMFRISKVSFGEARPIASNTSREGRKQNRSVVMKVFAPIAKGVMASGETPEPQQ